MSCRRRGWIWFFECPGLSSLLDNVLIERWDQMEATGPDPEGDVASGFTTKLILKLPLPPSPGIILFRSVLEVYTAKPRTCFPPHPHPPETWSGQGGPKMTDPIAYEGCLPY